MGLRVLLMDTKYRHHLIDFLDYGLYFPCFKKKKKKKKKKKIRNKT